MNIDIDLENGVKETSVHQKKARERRKVSDREKTCVVDLCDGFDGCGERLGEE